MDQKQTNFAHRQVVAKPLAPQTCFGQYCTDRRSRVIKKNDTPGFMSIKLLIADDERLFRQSLKILLETGTDIRVVADAADGQEAVAGARENLPDLALLRSEERR